jgi:TIR domain
VVGLDESSPGRIFISYRRQETAWAAGRLNDVLLQHFPAEQVFTDVDSIEPGEDFVERIKAAVGSCDVLLALIGPQWLTITDESGQRRLDNPDDYVRLEIETALKRKIRLIPILVDDARMPHSNQLPETLASLTRRNAVEINPATFDTKRLITAVQKTLAEEQAQQRAEEQVRREAEEHARRRTGRPLSVLVWSWLLVIGFVAAAVIGYVLWVSAEEVPNPVVTGMLLAAIVVVPPVVVWGWRRRHRAAGTSTRGQVDAAASRLAEQTLEAWSRQVVQRGIQAPAPVRVRWRWAATDVALPRQELTAAPSLPTDPGPLPSSADDPPGAGHVLNSGLVTRLHDEVYARLHHGRLVLIGGPGAGKTGAMILLLLEALRYRARIPETARIDVPVPVWLTLGSWDPSVQKLRDWVMATISRDHPYLRAPDFGPDAMAQLFDTGRIALFLDGLDEMPHMQRSKAVERLSAEAAGRRVVITSRPDEFRETIDLGRRQLPYTAAIELRPVSPRAAAGYLLEGQIGAARQAWQPVANHLLAHPDSVLAKTLNTPLTLSLARAAYTSDDPRALLTRTPADEHQLRVHLLDQILIAAYPDPGERAHAAHWLGWLAHKMGTQPNGPIRELRWWQIPTWIPHWQVGLAGALLGGLSVGVGVCLAWLFKNAAWLIFDLFVAEPPFFLLFKILLAGLGFGLFGALIVGLVSVLGVEAITPRSMTIRWPKLRDIRSVAAMVLRVMPVFALGFGLLSGVAIGVDQGLANGLIAGVSGGLTFGLIFGVVLGVPLGLVDVWRAPLAAMSAVTPRAAYRMDVRSHRVSGLMIGLTGGIVGGIGGWLAGPLESTEPLEPGWYGGLGLGLAFVLTLGLLSGLVSGFRAGAASSLLFTEIALWSRRRRVRFMPLLETALARQVLRQAGAVYEFRHADLQDRLAERYQGGQLQRRAT